MTAPINTKRQPPYKVAGLVLALLSIAAVVVVYLQFRAPELLCGASHHGGGVDV